MPGEKKSARRGKITHKSAKNFLYGKKIVFRRSKIFHCGKKNFLRRKIFFQCRN
jgi:hypothetical protein